jgi:hypothetical protein
MNVLKDDLIVPFFDIVHRLTVVDTYGFRLFRHLRNIRSNRFLTGTTSF